MHDEATFNTLFTAGQVHKISLGSRLKGYAAYFNRRSDVFTHNYVPHRAEYTLKTRVWNTQLNGFDELFIQLEGQTRDEKRYAEVSERYTQLPENLPDDVRYTAQAITGGIESPYMRANAISLWLAENMSYTLNPEVIPEGVDFTGFFLESREGYCVYYATAMTVLARCCGLPARYIQGFALKNTPWDSNYQYKATGLTAHAWSEVYFEGIGWLPFDPLSWDADAPLNEAADEDEQPPATPTPTPFPTPSIAPPENQPSEQEAGGSSNKNTILILILAGIFPSSFYVLYRLALRLGPRRIARAWTVEAVCLRFTDPSKQLDALYNDTLKLLALQGLAVHPDETLVTFPKRVDRIVATDGVKFADIADAMMKSHFGNNQPSGEDIERTCLYHNQLETLTLELLGKRKYLFKRVLSLR